MTVKFYETEENKIKNVSNTYNSTGIKNIVLANNITRLNVSKSNQETKSGIKEVRIGSNVKTIDQECFSGCKSLGSVTGGLKLVNVHASAFYECSSLANVDFFSIENNINSLGDNSFHGCGFEELTLHLGSKAETSRSIDDHVFDGCSKLRKLTLQCDQVYDSMFSNCDHLEEIHFGENFTAIQKSAFENCIALSSVSIGGKLNRIYDNAFLGCKGIDSFSFGTAAQLQDAYSVGNCILSGSNILSLEFPKSLTSLWSICDNALSGLDKLSSITFLGVTSADLSNGGQDIPKDIDTNIWLYATNDKIRGMMSYSKSITYDRMVYVINYAWENGIPMIIFDGCENCRYTDAILKVLNGGSFISWMKGLSKRFVFISFLQGSKSNSTYGYLYNGLYRNPAVFNYTFPDYRQSSRCGKVNVLWKQNDIVKKFSLLLHSTGKNVQSAKIHDKPWVSYEDKTPNKVYSETYDGTSYAGCKKYEDVQTILNDRIIGEELSVYSGNVVNINTSRIGETENRIKQTKCFGLNHNATLYSSEGYQIEYVNTVNI